MLAIISLLIVVCLSIVITRIATVALTHTGLSRESARFQARSALTGSGFTTNESERVVNHPVRRRIVMLLMLIGSVGIVGAMSSLILTFVGNDYAVPMSLRVVLLVAGLVLLWMLAMSPWVDRRLSQLISWALQRYTQLEVADYASLMHLAGEYRIVELYIEQGDWLANKTLGELNLRAEGVMVLGITRSNGRYLGVPKATTKIVPADTLIVYGRISSLEALDNRRDDWHGQQQHKAAIDKNKQVTDGEETSDALEQNDKRKADGMDVNNN
ncbi:MAG: TrkA C-terminal domain-containing protein [Candidatus Competibacteraceae bacterium]|jgi:hypothetical protein|nr:TrkA C-terminal domain-containing protein [Candidatus Competibacteraceae bacterium]